MIVRRSKRDVATVAAVTTAEAITALGVITVAVTVVLGVITVLGAIIAGVTTAPAATTVGATTVGAIIVAVPPAITAAVTTNQSALPSTPMPLRCTPTRKTTTTRMQSNTAGRNEATVMRTRKVEDAGRRLGVLYLE